MALGCSNRNRPSIRYVSAAVAWLTRGRATERFSLTLARRPVYLPMKHITLAILLAAVTNVSAETPKPAPTDAKVAQLVGRWEGTTKFDIRGDKRDWKTTAACERTAIGGAVTCSLVAVSGDMRLEEIWLFGYDKASDTYHLFTTNTWGEAYDHAGTWTDAKAVAFAHTGTRDGKALREEYRFAFTGKDEFTVTGTISLDGKAFAQGTTTAKRVR